MLVLHIVGARPNFMKAAPVIEALAEKKGVSQLLVHTGQHYDANMSEIFFDQLGLPKPDINLEVGSAGHVAQTAKIMLAIEHVLIEKKPDMVLVYGDVNSTVAVAIVCAKLLIPVSHVEAGLRSFDRRMPEEINRILTDQIANLLFTPSLDGNENLLREGIQPEKIHFVGNVMIDTLVRLLPKVEMKSIKFSGTEKQPADYTLVTLHRPSNVDEPEMLTKILQALEKINEEIAVVFPLHPRTRKLISGLKLNIKDLKISFIEPVGYLEFLALQQKAKVVITDSGGIQEETTYLGVPCLTVRENTERPITIEKGTNILVGQDMERLVLEFRKIIDGNSKKGVIPELWDGKAAERIADILVN